MSCNCHHCRKNKPTLRDGTGRLSRLLEALDPKNAPLDDRRIEDLLVQIKAYAAKIRFFPVPKEDDGTIHTWQAFLERDMSVILAAVALSDPSEQEKLYLDHRKQLYDDPSPGHFALLSEPIYNLTLQFTHWFEQAAADNPLRAELELLIRSKLSPLLQQAIRYALALSEPSKILELDITSDGIWAFDSNQLDPDDSIFTLPQTGDENEEDLHPLIGASFYIDDIFQAFYQSTLDTVASCHEYLDFSLEKYPQHQPHLALLIAFLELFKYLQQELNDVTHRHLEFFYKDVLHFSERPAEPDRVHVIFELAKGVSEYIVEQGTALLAGTEPDSGKDILYRIDEKLNANAAAFTPNRALVREIKNLYIERDNKNKTRTVDFHANPVANSADGNGTPFVQPSASFDTFGVGGRDEDTQLTLCNFLKQPSDFLNTARIGFAIATPQLLLGGGERVIELNIKGLTDILKGANDADAFRQILEVWITSEKGWLEVPALSGGGALYYGLSSNVLKITISVAAPKIIPFDAKLHPGDNFPTTSPVLKILLKSLDADHFNTPPEYENLVIDIGFWLKTTVGNGTAASGLKDLVVQNAMQRVENGKTFFAYTQMPANGTPLYIGSKEFFSKTISKYKIHIKWKAALTVKLNLTYLKDKLWLPAAALTTTTANNDTSDWDITNNSAINRTFNLDSSEFGQNTSNGYFKITPSELPDSPISSVAQKGLELQAEYVSLDYESTLSYGTLDPGVDQFFHLYPFGFAPIFATKNLGQILTLDALTSGLFVNAQVPGTQMQPKWHLFPQFQFGKPLDRVLLPDESQQYNQEERQTGHLFIGVEHLAAPQNLSLLFKFEEGTQADDDGTPPSVHWSYLINNEWRPLPADALLNDGTFGLLTTGIILFSLPKDINAVNTLMPTGQFWLCASVSDNPDRFPRLISIQAQATTATFDDRNNTPSHYDAPLANGKISSLKEKVDDVKSVSQPYESFGGRPADKGLSFYMEASERIRHKGRAVAVWDYEHMVLSQFPAVFKVKTIPVSDPDCICRKPKNIPCKSAGSNNADGEIQPCGEQIATGHVMIVPIPDFRFRVGGNRLQPKNSNRMLHEIEQFLGRRTSAFVKVHAKNPVYEEVLTAFRVQFKEGVDKGVFLRKLNEELVRYLTPWAFEAGTDVRFDGRVYASDVINFIEERPYVDFITDFRMFHCKDTCCAPQEGHFSEVEGVVNSGPDTLIQVLGSNLQVPAGKKFKILLADGDRIAVSQKESGTRIFRYDKKQHKLIDETGGEELQVNSGVFSINLGIPVNTPSTIKAKSAITGLEVNNVTFSLSDGLPADLASISLDTLVIVSAPDYADKVVVWGKNNLEVKLYPQKIDLTFKINAAAKSPSQWLDNARIVNLQNGKEAEKKTSPGEYKFIELEMGHVVVVSAEGFMPRAVLISEEVMQSQIGGRVFELELLPDCLQHLNNTDELIEFWEKVFQAYYPTVRGMELGIRPCTSRSILVSAAQHRIELYEPVPEPDPCAPPPAARPASKPGTSWQRPPGFLDVRPDLTLSPNYSFDWSLYQQYQLNYQLLESLPYLTASWGNGAFFSVLGLPHRLFPNSGFAVDPDVFSIPIWGGEVGRSLIAYNTGLGQETTMPVPNRREYFNPQLSRFSRF
jgi:hypothetical protein